MPERKSLKLIDTVQDYLREDIRVPASCISFLFSLWASFNTGIINLDGILYIKIAQNLTLDYVSDSHLFFFPFLISCCHKITGLGLEASAYSLIAVFSATLTYSFLSLLSLFTSSRRILFWGALIIVLHPEFIEAKHQIIRDHGFWAFYLLGLYFFLRFVKAPSWQNSIIWAVAMVTASLFRFEGLVLLYGLPFVLFVQNKWPWRKRIVHFLQANVMGYCGLIVAVYFVMTHGGMAFFEKIILTPQRYFNNLSVGLSSDLLAKASVIEESVLSGRADEFALPIVLLIPLVIIGGKLIGGLTPLYMLLLGWFGWVKGKLGHGDGVSVIVWAGVLNACIYVLFTYAMFFIQGRYVMGLVLLLLLLVPFVFERLCVGWQEASPGFSWQKIGLTVVALLLFVNFVEGVLVFHTTKFYMKDAGSWLATEISSEATLFSNNKKVAYYAGRFGKRGVGRHPVNLQKIAQDMKQHKYDYYALWVKRRHNIAYDDIVALFGQPVKKFTNERRDAVYIYAAPLLSQEKILLKNQ